MEQNQNNSGKLDLFGFDYLKKKRKFNNPLEGN